MYEKTDNVVRFLCVAFANNVPENQSIIKFVDKDKLTLQHFLSLMNIYQPFIISS